MDELKFYTLASILDYRALYNIIFGERSNGKTYSVLKYGLERYVKHKETMAVLRRWQEDFKGKRAVSIFDALIANDEIIQLTGGVWESVYYWSGRWYLCKTNEKGKRIIDDTPFAYAFSLSSMEHDKSTSFPTITTIMFDEFLTRGIYLPDEFVLFCNVISTIVRYRTNVKIFMLGNTVNKYCPYFEEMGIRGVVDMEPGDLRLYQYGEDGKLKIAVEYTGSISKQGKPSDIYFAFDNPRLKMITGGAWEIDMYPHCPRKYLPKEVQGKYYINFNGNVLECEVIAGDDDMFTFIHRKTTELQYRPEDLVFTTDYSPKGNIRRRIDKPADKIGQRIWNMFQLDKVFYQSNEIGEVVRNYLMWCRTEA